MTPLPTVSIVCPSYNRPQFLPFIVKFFRWQNYPQDRLELLILDDSQTSAHSLFQGETSVRYLHSDKRIDLGAKRNQLNKLAGGEIVVCFDDDDFYGPDRVRFAVNALRGSGAEFGGTADVLYYFSKLDRFVRFNHQICASSMFYTATMGARTPSSKGAAKRKRAHFVRPST